MGINYRLKRTHYVLWFYLCVLYGFLFSFFRVQYVYLCVQYIIYIFEVESVTKERNKHAQTWNHYGTKWFHVWNVIFILWIRWKLLQFCKYQYFKSLFRSILNEQIFKTYVYIKIVCLKEWSIVSDTIKLTSIAKYKVCVWRAAHLFYLSNGYVSQIFI